MKKARGKSTCHGLYAEQAETLRDLKSRTEHGYLISTFRG